MFKQCVLRTISHSFPTKNCSTQKRFITTNKNITRLHICATKLQNPITSRILTWKFSQNFKHISDNHIIFFGFVRYIRCLYIKDILISIPLWNCFMQTTAKVCWTGTRINSCKLTKVSQLTIILTVIILMILKNNENKKQRTLIEFVHQKWSTKYYLSISFKRRQKRKSIFKNFGI